MPARKKENFHSKLVLNQWLLRFFHGGTFKALQERLKEPNLEGVDLETGHTRFFVAMKGSFLFDLDRLSKADLARYDLNIVRHWNTITERRNQHEDTVMQMKYFQYLSLLFTELYLDWYFNRTDELLEALNQHLQSFNSGRKKADQFQLYRRDELNKLAFWNATGSGKTLLLHVNLLQYRHYFEDSMPRGSRIDKTILLTPNEGLSKQHQDELELSNLRATIFDKNQPALPGYVEVIDINKLADEMGDKTVAVEAFEGNNLVLVDEGHRGTGTSDGAWLARREQLCRNGFAFEYSATFGQGVAKSKSVNQLLDKAWKDKIKRYYDRKLNEISDAEKQSLELSADEIEGTRRLSVLEQYGKCILFDYSYKYFYDDGYGKESHILNLDDRKEAEQRQSYFTACLLSFYQQLHLYDRHTDQIAEFNIEKPLWIFVGNSVNDSESDVMDVICCLARFLNDPEQSKRYIVELLENHSRLTDSRGRSIFHGRFAPLMDAFPAETTAVSAEHIYSDVIKTLFNSPSRQRLRLILQKGSEGELTLQLGEAEPFGLINIGDAPKFAKLCDKHTKEFEQSENPFGGSYFQSINKTGSHINLLIGSRKFTEGWSSWRVSTMGLMNMGKGEGTQIIQLFGRGVRLKGCDFSLKRSKIFERPKGVPLGYLETLNIFGIKADYMARFKEYLREEGVTPSDEMLEVEFNTQRNVGSGKLKTLTVSDGHRVEQAGGFKRKCPVYLFKIPDEWDGKIKVRKARLDRYAHIKALHTQDGQEAREVAGAKHSAKFTGKHFAFMDFDRIYRRMLNYKLERTRYNLRLERERLEDFCRQGDSWYELLIPEAEMEFTGMADVEKWEKILVDLLIDYTDKFFEAVQKAYEDQYREYVDVDPEDEAFIKSYHFDVENTEEGKEYYERLSRLKQLMDNKACPAEVNKWSAPDMVAICFAPHLYYPLMHLVENKNNLPLRMHPLAFDAPSEVNFVKGLQLFYESQVGKEFFNGRSLYLLRNPATNNGVKFRLAGNFQPDFLLWVVEGDKQWLAFIDPKGLRNIQDLKTDSKINLYKEIKNYEEQLGDDNISLSSFILSDTKFNDLINNPFGSQSELEARNVLFLEDAFDSYLPKLFEKMIGDESSARE